MQTNSELAKQFEKDLRLNSSQRSFSHSVSTAADRLSRHRSIPNRRHKLTQELFDPDNKALEFELDQAKPRARHNRKNAILDHEIPKQLEVSIEKARPPAEVKHPTHYRTSSNKTRVEDTRISDSLNNVTLQMSSIRPKDAKRELSKVLRNSDIQAMRRKERAVTISPEQTRRSKTRSKVKTNLDSIFSAEEADLVLNEMLYTRTLVNDWKSVVSEMRENPKVLMNLIPLEKSKHTKLISPKSQLSRTFVLYSPSVRTGKKSQSIRASLQKPKANLEKLPALVDNDRRSRSTSPYFKSKKVSLTEAQVQTLLSETEDGLTEDWNNSLLNYNIRNGIEKFNADNKPDVLTVEEMSRISGAAPRDSNGLKVLYKKCLKTLEVLLIEMLGTKEDIMRFRDRYLKPTARSTMALLSKCLELIGIRHKTIELLKVIHKREDLIKSLPSASLRTKAVLMEIYRLTNSINGKITDWEGSNVPFDKFVFKGRHYPEKMASEQAHLVKFLAKELEFDV